MDTAKDTAELKRTDENLEMTRRMNIIANYRERSRANRASMRTKLCDHASHGSESERKVKVWTNFSNY